VSPFWFGFLWGAVSFGGLCVGLVLGIDATVRWLLRLDEKAERENKKQFR